MKDLEIVGPVEQTRSGVVVEYVDLDQYHLLFLLHLDDQVHHAFAQLQFLEFRANALKENGNFLQNELFFGLELRKEAPLIVLRDGSELIVMIEASELLQPLAIHPLPAPNIDQLLLRTRVILLS